MKTELITKRVAFCTLKHKVLNLLKVRVKLGVIGIEKESNTMFSRKRSWWE